MFTRKAKPEEEEIILDVANSAFAPIRPKGFNFRSLEKKEYQNPTHPFYSDHYLCFENDVPIGTFGNLLYETELNGHTYRFSFLGTVSVLPSYQKKGVMKNMMAKAEEDNLERKVAFSLLTGRRKRYQYYGYEKGSFSYFFTFDNYTVSHFASTHPVQILPMKEKDSSLPFSLYQKEDFLNLRKDKETFYLSLFTDEALPYLVLSKEGEFLGYFSYRPLEKRIIEIHIDKEYLESFLASFVEKEGSVTIEIPSQDSSYLSSLEEIAESIYLQESLHMKIYDVRETLLFLLNLNEKAYGLRNLDLTLSMEETNYHLLIQNHQVEVKTTTDKPDFILTKQSLVPFLLSPIPKVLNFPLRFSLSGCDTF